MNKCRCYECRKDEVVEYLDKNNQQYPITYPMTRMILCPTCGNKRCPHATDHNLQCTGSNGPGQPGSRYA